MKFHLMALLRNSFLGNKTMTQLQYIALMILTSNLR